MSDIVKILPYSIDLSKTVEKTDLRTLFVMDDNEAHRFELAITRGSTTVDLSGCTVTGFFTNFKENKTIKVDGSVENGSAVVTLSAPCYKLHGQFVLIVQIGSGGVDHSVFCGEGYMRTSKAETIIYDDYIIYDVNALLAQISAMKTATDSANAATAKATNAASTANTAAGNADAKAQAAQTAAEAANAAASKWDESLAADSEKLGGAPAADYLLKTGTAANAEKLGGAPAADYLLKTGTAANAEKLNGKDADEYAQVTQLNYVSPEMYGAVGDGVADDTNAIIACFTQTKPIWISQKYKVISPIDDTLGHSVSGNGLIIYDGEGYCFTVNIADARKDQRRYTYDLHIQCNGTNNGVNFLRTMGNVFNLSVFDAQIGVNLNVDSPVYENEINSQVEFNNGYGQIALNAMRGDNYFPKTFAKNYAKGVVNAGPNSYDIVHPWLYNDGGDECWAESIAFEEAGSGMGANINYLYIDTVRCGVKSTGGAPTHVGKCEMLVNPDIGDVFSENIPYVHSGNYLLTIDQFSGYQDFDHYRMFDTDSTRLYTDVRKANVSNAWLTSAGFADICFPVNVTNAHANLFGALPTGIKNAYTNGLVYVNPYPNCRQWSAIYWGVPKMYYSELAIPTDYYWIGCELTRS